MQMKPFSIYYLLDPLDGRVRYVGYSRDPVKRWVTHIEQSYQRRTHKEAWINSLVKQGLHPTLSVRCILNDAAEAKRVEVALIASLKAKGLDLTNGTVGGDGSAGFKWSEENYRKHEAYWTEERCREESERKKGIKQTEEHKWKTLAANTPELLARRGAAIKAGWARRNGAPTTRRGKGLSASHRLSIIKGKGLDSYVPDSQVSSSERLRRQVARSEKKLAKLKAQMEVDNC